MYNIQLPQRMNHGDARAHLAQAASTLTDVYQKCPRGNYAAALIWTTVQGLGLRYLPIVRVALEGLNPNSHLLVRVEGRARVGTREFPSGFGSIGAPVKRTITDVVKSTSLPEGELEMISFDTVNAKREVDIPSGISKNELNSTQYIIMMVLSHLDQVLKGQDTVSQALPVPDIYPPGKILFSAL